jgi:hypothetical protein
VTRDVFAAVADLPGVAAAVERARAAVDELQGHRVLRRSAERVCAESALRGARASAALEGADVALDVLRGGLAEGPVVSGALRVAAEVGRLRPAWRLAPLQALARLHALAAADLVAGDSAGRESLGRPSPAGLPRLQALAEALVVGGTAPALVVAAVVHGEVATSAAFPLGGGLVARAAARLTLITRGLDPGAVSVPEVGHLEAGATEAGAPETGAPTYAAALSSYAGGQPAGITAWVEHCADAVVLGAREGLAICQAVQRGA